MSVVFLNHHWSSVALEKLHCLLLDAEVGEHRLHMNHGEAAVTLRETLRLCMMMHLCPLVSRLLAAPQGGLTSLGFHV